MVDDEYDSHVGSFSAASKRPRYSRVSRACNECRVRKIRCNGRQPCEPCEDFERHCTFTSTRGQRMAGAPRTKILEDRLRRARALLSKLQSQNLPTELNVEINSIFESPPGSPSSVSDTPGPADDSSGDQLENMMDGKGRLTSVNKSTEYYGGGSGFAFLQQTHQLFDRDSPTQEVAAAGPFGEDTISRLFDSPLPDGRALAPDVSFSKLMPSRQTATELLHVVFQQAYELLQFLHEPTFQSQTDRLYDLDPMDFETSDHDFLPLFYSVTALGYLFHQKMHERYGCKGVVNQAMRHFVAARRMISVDLSTDIVFLQTVICFTLFLISTARLATAHTYVGLAVAASMRLGLHSQASCDGLSDLEKDLRRRVFWTIVKLDIYSGTVLGLPGMINLDYVDQPKPSGNARDYEDPSHGGFASLARRRMFAASAQYLEILQITSKVVRKLYPKTDEEARRVGGSQKIYVSSATILEIENDFKVWRDGLSEALGSVSQNVQLSNIGYELEMVHNFGHILLYRPFLHYLARTRDDKPPDPRHLRCATACVKVSRFTIAKSDEMLKQGFFLPAAWQSVYTVFLALVTLVFFLATQRGNKEYAAIQRDTECGIRILARTSCQEIGSRRCLDVLKVLIRRLSHIIDLDVDEICTRVESSCRNALRGAPQAQTSSFTAGEEDAPRPAAPRDNTPTQAGPIQSPHSKRQFAFHPHQPRPQPQQNPEQMPNVNMHPVNVPMYQRVPYPASTTMWETPAAVSPTGNHPYVQPFSYGATPPPHPPEPEGTDAYMHSEMELPYPGGFAWPGGSVQMARSSTGQKKGKKRESPPPMNLPLTQQDIAAFMQINPGEEPFL